MLQTNTAISVNGLEKSYKNLKVLNNVRFSVQKGHIFALLGSNGAGKTTTIKILTTLLKLDSGNAQVGGFDVVRQPELVREEISLTGQYTALDEVLTGRENLQMIGQLRHLSDVNLKTEEMLERFDLLDAADRPVATYSGGMRRRLDLTMSLIGSPSIIFLDEPTTGLDPQSRMVMWKIIKDLARAETTVFLTTQYLEEADQLADQIAILNELNGCCPIDCPVNGIPGVCGDFRMAACNRASVAVHSCNNLDGGYIRPIGQKRRGSWCFRLSAPIPAVCEFSLCTD